MIFLATLLLVISIFWAGTVLWKFVSQPSCVCVAKAHMRTDNSWGALLSNYSVDLNLFCWRWFMLDCLVLIAFLLMQDVVNNICDDEDIKAVSFVGSNTVSESSVLSVYIYLWHLFCTYYMLYIQVHLRLTNGSCQQPFAFHLFKIINLIIFVSKKFGRSTPQMHTCVWIMSWLCFKIWKWCSYQLQITRMQTKIYFNTIHEK